uniref:40S ribosomal protein S15 n=1 Tax=Aegilops tauschii TaxID=37682 RepID=N1QXP2_AEGTA
MTGPMTDENEEKRKELAELVEYLLELEEIACGRRRGGGGAASGQPKKRTFRKFSYRGFDLDAILDMSAADLIQVLPARARRRGFKRKQLMLIRRLRKAKAKMEALAGEKPGVVKTHLRDTIIVPEMTGSQIAVYNGKNFNQVEIKPEMIGHYLAEFSISYKPVKHGRPALGLFIQQKQT